MGLFSKQKPLLLSDQAGAAHQQVRGESSNRPQEAPLQNRALGGKQQVRSTAARAAKGEPEAGGALMLQQYLARDRASKLESGCK